MHSKEIRSKFSEDGQLSENGADSPPDSIAMCQCDLCWPSQKALRSTNSVTETPRFTPERPHRTDTNNLRPLHILKVVAAAAAPVSPAEVGEALDLPKPTIHRLFQTLTEEGWLMQDLGGRGFVAGHLLRRMAANTLSGPGLRRERMAILQRLATEVGETCNISMPADNAMIYVDRVETHWPLQIRLPIGSRVPLHRTSSGKTYLSTLPRPQLKRILRRLALNAHTPNTITSPEALTAEIDLPRDRGYGADDQEMIDGMIPLAVPVRDNLGRVFGTISFHAPVQRLTLNRAVEHLPLLKRTATELAETI